MGRKRQLVCVLCNKVSIEADVDKTGDDENDANIFAISNAKAFPEKNPCPFCGYVPDDAFIIDPDDDDDLEDGEDEKSPDPFKKSGDWWKTEG